MRSNHIEFQVQSTQGALMQRPGLVVVVSAVLVFLVACSENPRIQIQAASSMVCDGEPYPAAAAYVGSGPHPIVMSFEDGTWHYWNDELSDEWFPSSSEQTQLVACIDEKDVRVELCEYSGPDIKRLRPDIEMTLVVAKTGEIIARHTFQGEEPRSCGYSEDYDLTELRGEKPDYEPARAWLQGYVESDAQTVQPIATQTARPLQTVQPTITEIDLFCGALADTPQIVSIGQQISFYWRWGAATEELVQNYIEAASFFITLDDEMLSFVTIRSESPCEAGRHCATWRLSSPMTLDPGSHSLRLGITLDREVTDGLDLNLDGELDTYGPGTVLLQPSCEVIVQ
jgi:hypothetical protein